jgi:hypothetical protein
MPVHGMANPATLFVPETGQVRIIVRLSSDVCNLAIRPMVREAARGYRFAL